MFSSKMPLYTMRFFFEGLFLTRTKKKNKAWWYLTLCDLVLPNVFKRFTTTSADDTCYACLHP